MDHIIENAYLTRLETCAINSLIDSSDAKVVGGNSLDNFTSLASTAESSDLPAVEAAAFEDPPTATLKATYLQMNSQKN